MPTKITYLVTKFRYTQTHHKNLIANQWKQNQNQRPLTKPNTCTNFRNSNNPFPSSALRIGRTNPLPPRLTPHPTRRPPSFRINCNQKEGHECSPPLSWCAMLKICPTSLFVCEFVCMCCVVHVFIFVHACLFPRNGVPTTVTICIDSVLVDKKSFVGCCKFSMIEY